MAGAIECRIASCANEARAAKGMCWKHYQRARRHGDPLTVLIAPPGARVRQCSIKDCDRNVAARSWCQKHYQRWQRHGDPLAAKIMTAEIGLHERLYARLDCSGGIDACWEFHGARLREGYGQLKFRGDDLHAHRVAYELANGSIPEGLHVLHHCDNPPCCNPRHLYAGTNADNVADRVARMAGLRESVNVR